MPTDNLNNFKKPNTRFLEIDTLSNDYKFNKTSKIANLNEDTPDRP